MSYNADYYITGFEYGDLGYRVSQNTSINVQVTIDNSSYWETYDPIYISGSIEIQTANGTSIDTIAYIDEYIEDFYSNTFTYNFGSIYRNLAIGEYKIVSTIDNYGVIDNFYRERNITTTATLDDNAITTEETTTLILNISQWDNPSSYLNNEINEWKVLLESNENTIYIPINNNEIREEVIIVEINPSLFNTTGNKKGVFNISFINDTQLLHQDNLATLTITAPIGFFSNVNELSLNNKIVKQITNLDNDKIFYENQNAFDVIFEPALDGTDSITSWTSMTNKTENGIFYSHGSFLTDGWSNNDLWKLEFDVKCDNWTYVGLMPVCDSRINPYTDANTVNYAMTCWEGITYTGGLGLTAFESQDTLTKITNNNWHHIEYTKLSSTKVKIVIDNTYTAIGEFPNLPNLETLHIGSRDNQYSRNYGGIVQYKNIKVMGPKESICDTIELEGFNGTVGDTAMQSGRVVGDARFKKNNATISANGEQAIFELRRVDNNALVDFIKTEISADCYAYFDIESRKLGDLKLIAQHGTVKSNTLIIEDCDVYNQNTYTNTSPTIASTHPLPMQLDFDIKKTNTSSTSTGILLIGNVSYPHLGLGFGSSSNYGLVMYERRAYATNNQIINISNTSKDWIHITAKIYENKAIMTVNETDYIIDNIQIDLSAPIVWSGSNNSQQYVSIKNIKVKKLEV